MSTRKRLSEVFNSAREITFDDDSKFIFFSDCHRGDNSWADDFAHNQNLFFFALKWYFENEFTYIEIGDGDEIWENRNFAAIRNAHSHVFWLMREFHRKNRLYFVFGNHDIIKKSPRFIEKELSPYFDESIDNDEQTSRHIETHEGLILKHSTKGKKIFVIHGYQGELINDRLWWFAQFCVRHVWRHLQLLGIKDPTSPAKNFKRRIKVENRIIEWVNNKNQIVIAGHTHRPRFPNDENEPPFFNTGSCVHPRCITGIEIEKGEIKLIKWWFEPNDSGALCVTRRVLEGPKKL